MTYRGHVKQGQIVLDEPTPLPEDAAVSVRVLRSANGKPGRPLTRAQILQLPLDQRRQLLARQSESLIEFYKSEPDVEHWQGGDILE